MNTTSPPIATRLSTSPLVMLMVVMAWGLIQVPCGSTASAQSPIRLKKAQPVQRMKWSASRIDADAAAVPSHGPRTSTRRSVAPNPTIIRSAGRRVQPQRLLPERHRSEIEQVGFLDGPRHPHGSVCDCDACGSGYLSEPACGLEYEVGCGMEAACGFEPACGLESGIACGCDACCGVGGACGVGGCDGYACGNSCQVDCFPLFLPILRVDWNRFEFFWGAQAFHNPMNDPATGAGTRTDSGSFGMHQGFNEGRNLRPWLGLDLAAQFGLRATQSNFHGEDFSGERRDQIFLTGGLFRRVDYGLQYGVVLDYLNEDWYFQSDLLQLRGELSWKMSACHNFGFHWMAGVNDDTVTTMVTNEAGVPFVGTSTIAASDQYRAFYRRSFGSSGEWTSYIGGTDDSHFIWGTDVEVPLKSGFSMQVSSVYFSPDEDADQPEDVGEGWNLGISFVFRPGACHPSNRYRRPLFDVADNGSFLTF